METTDTSASQARAQYESIAELVAELDREPGGEAQDRIWEDALDVNVRTGWYVPGNPPEPEEYLILLCTGGPAVRIRGELNEFKQPLTAILEHQDWFTPWTEYELTSGEQDTLRRYAHCFYYGE